MLHPLKCVNEMVQRKTNSLDTRSPDPHTKQHCHLPLFCCGLCQEFARGFRKLERKRKRCDFAQSAAAASAATDYRMTSLAAGVVYF